MASKKGENGASELTLFARLLGNGKDLSPALARHVLTLSFTPKDQARMHELALKNQAGSASAREKEELDSYAKAGCLLGILHSKARQALRRRKVT